VFAALAAALPAVTGIAILGLIAATAHRR